MRPYRILDLFCGAGGAAKGYADAGFEVVGVDINPQKRYPYEFVKGDWHEFFEAHWQEFDVFHASPPCQSYSKTRSISKSTAPKLITEVRVAFAKTYKPYVIENVVGSASELINPIRLRGNQFGLKVIRDRLFEVNPWILSSPVVPVTGTTNSHRGLSTGGDWITVAGHNFLLEEARAAMGIDWMSSREIAQAIPPAYTQWIGTQLLEIVERLPCHPGC